MMIRVFQLTLKRTVAKVGANKGMTKEDALMILDQAQAYGLVDAVLCEAFCALDIVRCKDCIHRVTTKDGEYDEHDIVCDYWMSDGLDSTDFCSYGERREP